METTSSGPVNSTILHICSELRVAVKHRVWRSVWVKTRISSTCFLNYGFIRRSASSRTTNELLECKLINRFWQKSMTFPGVPTTTWFEWLSICFHGLTPPKMGLMPMFSFEHTLSRVLNVVVASSRLGNSTRPIGPSFLFRTGYSKMCCIIGTRYEKVLPEPVGAQQIKSRPWRHTGIDILWIGLKSSSLIAYTII